MGLLIFIRAIWASAADFLSYLQWLIYTRSLADPHLELKERPLLNKLLRVDRTIGAECIFVLECGSRLFEILLSAQSKKDSIERHYLDRINNVRNDEPDVIYNEIADILAVKCRPFFRQFAGNPNFIQTLDKIIGSPTIRLHMTSHDGNAQIVLRSGEHFSPRISAEMRKDDLCDNMTIFALDEVKVLESLKEDAVSVFKVSINESVMCAKVAVAFSRGCMIFREVRCLQLIHTKDPRISIHVPRLHGLLMQNNQILGFVMGYFKPTSMVRTLMEYDMDSFSLIERRKWYCHIKPTLT